MNKKKWTRLCIWGLFLFCALITYSCLQDEQIGSAKGSGEKMIVGNNRELTAVVAQQWYDKHDKPVVPLFTRSDGKLENADGLLLKPRWEEAKENRIGKFEVVEVTLTTNKPAIFMDNETKERFNQEKDQKTVYNIARLVVLKNLDTQEVIDFIMIFVGQYDYLKESKTFGKNSYLHREPDYTGDVLFYSTKGEFWNGWRYEYGKIIATLSPSTEEGYLQSVTTRAMQQVCHTEVDWVTTFECWGGSYYDPEFGWGPSVTCTPITTPRYRSVCEWMDDGLGNGGWMPPSNPNGTGGGTTVSPPEDKADPKDPKNVLEDSTIMAGMKETWKLVLKSASASLGRREVAAWLFYDSVSKKYYVGNLKLGPYVQGEDHGNIETGSPSRSANGDHIPSTASAFSFMHAHTALTHESSGITRPVGPSPTDIDYANTYPEYNFYVIDYVGKYDSNAGCNMAVGGTSENAEIQIYIYNGNGVIEKKPIKK